MCNGQTYSPQKSFSILAKNSCKTIPVALFHIKTRVYLKYFVNDCLYKLFILPIRFRFPSNLICLTILLTLKLLKQFQHKIRVRILRKSAKIGLTWWLVFWYFHWTLNLVLKNFEIWTRTFFQKNNANFSQKITLFNHWSC